MPKHIRKMPPQHIRQQMSSQAECNCGNWENMSFVEKAKCFMSCKVSPSSRIREGFKSAPKMWIGWLMLVLVLVVIGLLVLQHFKKIDVEMLQKALDMMPGKAKVAPANHLQYFFF
jgi:hypothetical protein